MQFGCAFAQTLFVAPFAAGLVHLQVAGEVAARAGILLLALALLLAEQTELTQVLIGFPIFDNRGLSGTVRGLPEPGETLPAA